MVNRDLVAAKLVELADHVARVVKHRPESTERLRSDRDALDLISFNLMLAVQVCADVASHIIADERWPAARNLAEGFERLAQRGVVSDGVARALGKAVGFRNVVAHGYARIDIDMVFAAATQGVLDLDAFAREVGAWLAQKPRRNGSENR